MGRGSVRPRGTIGDHGAAGIRRRGHYAPGLTVIAGWLSDSVQQDRILQSRHRVPLVGEDQQLSPRTLR
jgi:hypothetical protein